MTMKCLNMMLSKREKNSIRISKYAAKKKKMHQVSHSFKRIRNMVPGLTNYLTL